MHPASLRRSGFIAVDMIGPFLTVTTFLQEDLVLISVQCLQQLKSRGMTKWESHFSLWPEPCPYEQRLETA